VAEYQYTVQFLVPNLFLLCELSWHGDMLWAGRPRNRSSIRSREKNFSSFHSVQTDFVAHPTSYPTDTEDNKAAGTWSWPFLHTSSRSGSWLNTRITLLSTFYLYYILWSSPYTLFRNTLNRLRLSPSYTPPPYNMALSFLRNIRPISYSIIPQYYMQPEDSLSYSQ
jgi:hypothetical protein